MTQEHDKDGLNPGKGMITEVTEIRKRGELRQTTIDRMVDNSSIRTVNRYPENERYGPSIRAYRVVDMLYAPVERQIGVDTFNGVTVDHVTVDFVDRDNRGKIVSVNYLDSGQFQYVMDFFESSTGDAIIVYIKPVMGGERVQYELAMSNRGSLDVSNSHAQTAQIGEEFSIPGRTYKVSLADDNKLSLDVVHVQESGSAKRYTFPDQIDAHSVLTTVSAEGVGWLEIFNVVGAECEVITSP